MRRNARLGTLALIGLGWLAGAAGATRAAAPEPLKNIVELTLDGPIVERATPFELFGGARLSLEEVEAALERARVNPEVAAVVVRLAAPELALAQVQALRAKLAHLRAAGKMVFCYLHQAGHADYLLAAAADRIALAPAGSLDLVGLSADVYFFKGLLDKIGVTVDLIQVGAYKGAAEPFSRSSMSPELRQMLAGLLDEYSEQMVSAISQGRQIPAARLKTLIDNGPYLARGAKEAGLVDWLAYPDEFDAQVKGALKGPTQFVKERFGREGLSAEVLGNPLALMSAFLSMMQPEAPPPAGEKPRVAVVHVTGTIVEGEADADWFGQPQAAAGPIVRALRQARQDPSVRAVVLRVNSPGGSVLASDLIWREVAACAKAKPLVASMGEVAASGGYYVAAPATAILAEPGTLTGSIGVVGGKVVLGGLYEKIGIHKETITRGRRAGLGSEASVFTEEERRYLTGLMQEVYDDFVKKVADGRRMAAEKVEPLAQGRIWTGAGAQRVGLVDELGGLEDALRLAVVKAGLKPETKVERLLLPRQKGFLERILGGGMGAHLPPGLEVLSGVAPAEGRLITRALTQAHLLRRDRVAALLPIVLEVR